MTTVRINQNNKCAGYKTKLESNTKILNYCALSFIHCLCKKILDYYYYQIGADLKTDQNE